MGKLRILFRWRSERFSLWHYGPFAVMLSGPVLGFQPGWLGLWTLSLLLQSRLSDDLWSQEDDGVRHPERVLVGLSSLTVPIVSCCLLVLLNGLVMLGRDLRSGLFYFAFLALQLRWFPSFAKYGCLVLLVDQVAGADPLSILWHAVLVAVSAAAFELGHDHFRERGPRLTYGLLTLIPLGFQPFSAASCFVGLGLCRLHPNMEKTRARRFLSAAMPHVSVALIAAKLFHRHS